MSGRAWLLGGCLLGFLWTTAARPAHAATHPSLCTRAAALQRAVLDALDAQGAVARDCATVTEAHLAGIRALGQAEAVRVTRAADLAGLAGLETLRLRFDGERVPADLLAASPRLRALTLDLPYPATLPTDLFAPVSRLTHLILPCLPAADFLRPVPRLAHLVLDCSLFARDALVHAPHLTRLEASCLEPAVLAPVPRLTHLVLDCSLFARDALVHAPHLTRLEASCLEPAVLAPVPRLTHLTLACLPSPGTLARVPQLTHLTLAETRTSVGARADRKALPSGFLAPVPRLTHLTLRSPYLEAWPPDLLAYAPDLVRLELQSAALRALSPAFLASVPRLTHLALQSPAGMWPSASLPTALLRPVPRLTHLALRCASPWPAAFLRPVPRLTHLELCFAYPRKPLPSDFLAPVPRLTHLALTGTGPLSPDFLAPVPRLTHLALTGTSPLSPDFLAPVPRLTHLTEDVLHFPQDALKYVPRLRQVTSFLFDAHSFAYTPHLTQVRMSTANAHLPSGFLAHTPRLERLELFAPRLQALPSGFLAHTPRLTYLDLHSFLNLRSLADAAFVDAEDVERPPALTTIPDDFLAAAPRLAYLNLPVRRLASVPAPVRAHLQALATLAVVAAPAAPHVDFPAGDPGLCAAPARRLSIETVYRERHHFAAPLEIVLDCAGAREGQPAPAPGPFSFRFWPHYSAFASLRLALDCAGAPARRPVPAPWPLCRPSRPFALPGAARSVVAWLDGLVPLRARPHAQSPVAGYAYRGDVVRVEARYAAGAWLRVRLVNPDHFPASLRFENGPAAFWLPAAAVQPWLPEDESLCPYCDAYRSLVGWG